MASSARYELVSVDAIELDTTNPRIAHALSSYKPPYKAEQIYLALNAGGREEEGGTTTTFNKLKQSIFTRRRGASTSRSKEIPELRSTRSSNSRRPRDPGTRFPPSYTPISTTSASTP